jgi:hypothetical protein
VSDDVPTLRQIVLDGTDIRALAEFWRELLGLHYRPGDEQPGDDEDWLVLRDAAGSRQLAFQRVERLTASTWPDDSIPQQLHLDLTVSTADDLLAQHDRALALGARQILDRFDDPDEPLRVYADPADHPFCIFVASSEV